MPPINVIEFNVTKHEIPLTLFLFKGNIYNSRLLARKYAWIFVRGHYLFREAKSFPRTLRGTDNVQGQISEHIFAPNGRYCSYYPSNIFRKARSFESWGIFCWGIFGHVTGLDQSRASKNS